MVFECPRCKYSTNKKSSIVNHLHKKTPCNPIHSDISIEDILISLNNIDKPHKCDQCDKSFSHSSSLSRHINTTHVNITDNSSNHHNTDNNHHNTDSNHHNTTNNITNNNTTNNYTIHPVINIELKPFDNERMDYILEDMELLTKYLKNAIREGLVEMFKKIHLNEEVHENQNIKFKRNSYPSQVKVYKKIDDRIEWIIEEASPIIERSIKKMVNILMIHNFKLYDGIENPTNDDRELYEERDKNLMDIKCKVRGMFAPIRNNIMQSLRNHANPNEVIN
jgi:uncharacterized C2H2 Zn-finger protein